MSDPLYDKICERITSSYPKACILRILEVCNDTLREKYNNRKLVMERDYRIKDVLEEKQLFHGTNTDCIESICKNGFIAKYNKNSSYGKGTYFAEDASYSFGFMHNNETKKGAMVTLMILADVLCGRSFNGNVTDFDRYDNGIGPRMYVIPRDDACYPRYIISFHKNAL